MVASIKLCVHRWYLNETGPLYFYLALLLIAILCRAVTRYINPLPKTEKGITNFDNLTKACNCNSMCIIGSFKQIGFASN